jgi:hypothetical protein
VLRALSVCAPITLFEPPPGLAQTFDRTSLTADIPARPLAEALATFAIQTGVQLVYVCDVVRNRRSHEAAAGLTAEAALAHLLEGTGLQFEYLMPYSVRILAVSGAWRDTSMAAPERRGTARGDRHGQSPRGGRAGHSHYDPDADRGCLANLNATTFDDFVTYLPGATSMGRGPPRATSSCAVNKNRTEQWRHFEPWLGSLRRALGDVSQTTGKPTPVDHAESTKKPVGGVV